MPVDLGSIPPEDRQDFEKRLRIYGLTTAAVQEPLVVSSGQVTLAFGPNRPSARTPHVIETTDFAAIKRMVGISDQVFRNVSPRVTLPGRVELGTRLGGGAAGRGGAAFKAGPGFAADDPEAANEALNDVDFTALDEDSLANIRLAARAFVRGNSELVTSFRPMLEKAIGRVTIPVFPLLTVKVPNGTVLEFGPGVNVLVAYKVEIEQGGIIRSRGHLTVNCTKITRPSKRGFVGGLGKVTLTGNFRPIFND